MTSSPPLRTRIIQLDVLPGRPDENTANILGHIAEARRDRVELIIFPEMAVPGYLLSDEWEYDAFLRECERCNQDIREASEGIIVVFGSVGIDREHKNEDGRVRKFNALFVASNRRFVPPENGPHEFVIKTLLPNYREFDDSRYFFDLRKLALERDVPLKELVTPVRVGGLLLGCVLCEDGWDMDYNVSPLDLLAEHNPNLFINISSSPYTASKNHKRNRVFSQHASRHGKPLIYVNNVGIQNNGKTVFCFDGSSCVYDAHGNSVECPDRFEESSLTLDIPLSGEAVFGKPVEIGRDGIPEIYSAIHHGTSRFAKLCGVERVTVGISGGIDSAVVAAIYSRILAPENLLLVNMPSRYNSSTTIRLAEELARNIGCCYAEVPIQDSVELTHRQIDGLEIRSPDGSCSEKLSLNSFMMENVQARDRSSRVLSAISSAFGGVFTCNANKSEATVGYGTLYGDLSGYLANIADLWKTEVYDLARHLNSEVFEREIIPPGILELTPSAELSPNQAVDEGKGDPLVYEYHDCLFRSWVESWNRTAPEDILEWYSKGTLSEHIGYKGSIDDLFTEAEDFISDLERWWSLYKGMGVAKRIQAPPVLAVKRRAFGFDHRESQMGVTYTRRYNELKKQFL